MGDFFTGSLSSAFIFGVTSTHSSFYKKYKTEVVKHYKIMNIGLHTVYTIHTTSITENVSIVFRYLSVLNEWVFKKETLE